MGNLVDIFKSLLCITLEVPKTRIRVWEVGLAMACVKVLSDENARHFLWGGLTNVMSHIF